MLYLLGTPALSSSPSTALPRFIAATTSLQERDTRRNRPRKLPRYVLKDHLVAQMSSQESLKSAMRETLEANGTMSHIKAELRAAVFQSLSAASPASGADGDTATVPPENLIINELIKEYLVFNGLEHTLAVFQLEARVPDSQVPRRVLSTELNLNGAPTSIPLLYSMIHEARLSRDLQRE